MFACVLCFDCQLMTNLSLFKFHCMFLSTCKDLQVVWTQNTSQWKSSVSKVNMVALDEVDFVLNQILIAKAAKPNGKKEIVKLGNTQVNRGSKNVSLRHLFTNTGSLLQNGKILGTMNFTTKTTCHWCFTPSPHGPPPPNTIEKCLWLYVVKKHRI